MDRQFCDCRDIRSSVGSLVASTALRTNICIYKRNDGACESPSSVQIENGTVVVEPSMAAIYNAIINH